MVLIDAILAFSIMLLALAIYQNKGKFTFTIKIQKVEEQVGQVDQKLSDLSEHFKKAMSQEEEEYYKQSYGVLQALNEILSGKIPDDEEDNK